MHDLLLEREEFESEPEPGPESAPDYASLFYGRIPTPDRPITIGPRSGRDDLRIEAVQSHPESPFTELPTADELEAVRVVYRDEERFVSHPGAGRDEPEWPVIECGSLGSGLPDNRQLARLWERATLAQATDLLMRFLRLATDGIESAFVAADERRRIGNIMVVLRGQPCSLSLKSLGDGAMRRFVIALALASSRGGFLVVDGVENGIHHSGQSDFWRLVFRTVRQLEVQMLATTHRYDCVKGFARAAAEAEAESVLVRLERNDGQVRAVEYTREHL